MTERQAGAEGLGEVEENSKKIRGKPQSVGNVLHGIDTDGTPIWIEYFFLLADMERKV